MSEAKRRLAAILAADVAGYSAMVGADEPGTLTRVRALRTDVIESLAATHEGRLFKTTGDGFLVEFASAVQALRCAIAIQTKLNAQPDGLRLRIGVHQGEVVTEGDDVFGDGVIIAARLEPLAEHGGIVISSRVMEDAAGKIALEVDDLGEPPLKNITPKIRTFRVRLQGPVDRPVLTLPDKPSLVVLPFQNMSGDPEQEYFADGMVDEITTALSRIHALFVIARSSAFAYKGKSPDVRQVGRDLGVRYVLEGSVRKAGNRVRITGQLIDAATGAHLWADRFDGDLTDVFDMQDRVTASVAGAIEPRLQRAEIERAQRKPTQDLGAYDYFLRGVASFHQMKSDQMRKALALFIETFNRDANFGAAHAMAAFCIAWLKGNVALGASSLEPAEGERLALLASATGKDDATALAWAGLALAFLTGDVDSGLLMTERACVLNPNSAAAWANTAWLNVWSGDANAAFDKFARAMRLSPLDPQRVASLSGMALAHLQMNRFQEAVDLAARAVSEQPNSSVARRIQSASLALAGRLDEARRAMDEMRKLTPAMRLSEASDWMMPFRRPEDVARYTEGLRLAGMPE